MKPRTWHTLVIALLILAASLRGYNLHNRGIFDYDEAWYLLEAKSLYDTIQFTWKKSAGQLPADIHLKDYVKERGTVPLTAFKPGHTLLVLLGLLIFGLHDYASFLISAIAGLLTVYLLYRIGYLMYGPRTGLLAGLVLAVSPFHIGYSRAGYAQANSLFFVTLGLYLWYRQYRANEQRLQPLFWSGIAIGYAFTCHFNLFTIPLLILAYEAASFWKQRNKFPSFASGVKRLAVLGAGMAAPLVLFELPVRVARMLGKLPTSQLTYYEQFLYRGSLVGKLHFSLEGTWAILEKLFLSEGLFILIGLAAACTWICLQGRKNRFEDLVLFSLLLVPALPWCLLSVGLPPLFRTFTAISLPLSLLVARGLLLAADHLSLYITALRRSAFPALCALVLVNGCFHAKDLLPIHSSYEEATDQWLAYAEREGGQIAFFPGSVWPIWYFYLSAHYDTLSPTMQQQIRFYPNEKDALPPEGDYDAFDIKRYTRAVATGRTELQAYFEHTRNKLQPIIRLPNPAADLPFAYAEAGGDPFKRNILILRSLPAHNHIEIYDLRSQNNQTSSPSDQTLSSSLTPL